VSQPNDKYEQEADRVADQIMRMPEPSVTPNESAIKGENLSIQRLENSEDERDHPEENLQLKRLVGAESIQRQELEEDEEKDEEEEMLQTKHSSSQVPEITPSIEMGIQSLRRSGGQPLPSSIRTFMESRFNQDFSDVRLHRTVQASQLAQSLDAQAFTLHRNIVFGAAQFQPQTPTGQRLIAHELAHAIQQGSSSISAYSIQRRPQPNSRHERQSVSKRRRLLRFLERVERRAQAGRRFIPTRRRSEKAEQVLCQIASGELERTISAEAKSLLLQIVQSVKGRPPECLIAPEAPTTVEESEEKEETETVESQESGLEFPPCPEVKEDKPTSGSKLIIIANGYPGYKEDALTEIEDAKAKSWMPNTPDFNEAVQGTTGSFLGASDSSEFIGALQGESGFIERVVFVGHGFTDAIAFSGDTSGNSTAFLEAQELPKWQSNIDIIRSKLTANAKIDLFACNTGVSSSFLQAMANAFCACVRGYEGFTQWCLHWNKSNQITQRGRWAPPKTVPDPDDCEGSGWVRGFNTAPPIEVCPAGKPKSPE